MPNSDLSSFGLLVVWIHYVNLEVQKLLLKRLKRLLNLNPNPVTLISLKEEGAEKDGYKRRKLKKEEAAPKAVAPEDEKYRLGYGVAGKGVKLPWYLEKRNVDVGEGSGNDSSERVHKDKRRKTGKKTVEELREERLKRERREKERERALLIERNKTNRTRKDTRFSRR